jgi:hypothetical protein
MEYIDTMIHPHNIRRLAFLSIALCCPYLQAAQSDLSGSTVTAPVVLPFDYVNQHIFVTLKDEKLSTLSLFVDTGASGTSISSSAAARGVIHSSFWKPGVTFTGYGNHPVHHKEQKVNVSLRSGETLLLSKEIRVVDFGEFGKKLEHPMDGILGWDFFERWCTTLDYTAKQLTVRPLAACIAPTGKHGTLQGKWSSGGLLLRSVLTFANGRSAPALLKVDTGSDSTIHLNPQFRQVAGLEDKKGIDPKLSGWGFNGEYGYDMARVTAVNIEGGQINIDDKQGSDISIGRSGSFSSGPWWYIFLGAKIKRDGGIGNGFLQNATWTFDPAAKRIYVTQ